MNIILGPISILQIELSLLNKKTTQNFAIFAFYIDDIFEAFNTHQDQYIFLYDPFFPYIV